MKYEAKPVIVDAYIIVGVGCIQRDGSLHCALQNGENAVATKEMISRFIPDAGDYWVVQADGYAYLNPKDVFERKYQPMEADMATPNDFAKFHHDNVAKLDPVKRAAAVAFLRDGLSSQAESIRAAIKADPQEWWVAHHHGAMMGIRNKMRGGGFGEKEMGVDNLDDYAVGLVEMAVAEFAPTQDAPAQ